MAFQNAIMCLLNISGLSPAIALLSTGYLTIDSLDMTDINVSDCIVIILVYCVIFVTQLFNVDTNLKKEEDWI